MKRWRVGRLTVVLTLAWAPLIWTTSCSRQLDVPGSVVPASSSQLPFDRVSDNSGLSPTAGFASDGIPAGTEVIVRLQLALSSADSRAGDAFHAVLDEPVVVAGRTLVPRGTLVTGNVLAAKASGGLNDPGYLRVALASIAMNGGSVPVQTSSIFAKGGSYEKRKPTAITKRSETNGQGLAAEPSGNSGHWSEPSINPGQGDVKFSTGRRLTFRLAQPLHRLG